MCTVIHYLYTCGHYISRRPSRCGGTRFKFTRSSRRAACTADGYITIKRITPCSKCLKDIWSAQWEKKLEKARKFHQELAEKKMSGAKEILGLIGELETKCELESWELKNELPYGGNPRVRRVNPVDLDKPKLPASPLRLEVRPEEVVLQVVSEPVYDDDDGWEPSTDPMHPVTTNYEVLCAGIDDDYLEFLTGDMGVDSNLDHEASDLSAGSWDWGGGRLASSPDNQMLEGQSSVVGYTEPSTDTQELTAWDTAWKDGASPGEPGMDGLPATEELHAKEVEAVVQKFWETINIDDDQQLLSQASPMNQLDGFLNRENSIAADLDNASVKTSLTLQYGWTDGASDSLLSPPFETHCASESTPSSPTERRTANSTVAKYDMFRQDIMPLKAKDPRKFYAQWLVECRLEIREIVGPDGAMVYDPPR